jgi:hypothetical protein
VFLHLSNEYSTGISFMAELDTNHTNLVRVDEFWEPFCQNTFGYRMFSSTNIKLYLNHLNSLRIKPQTHYVTAKTLVILVHHREHVSFTLPTLHLSNLQEDTFIEIDSHIEIQYFSPRIIVWN